MSASLQIMAAWIVPYMLEDSCDVFFLAICPGMPHFWDVQKQRGPFYSNQRLMDPGVLRRPDPAKRCWEYAQGH